MSAGDAPLKLRAEDAGDLQILSAAVQDALFRPGDVAFDARARRFTLLADRFRWEASGRRGPFSRVRCVLAFEAVLAVRSRRLRRQAAEAHGVILSVSFMPAAEPPGGVVRVLLAGDGEIRLEVECLDALMTDMGQPWPTAHRPDHDRPADPQT